MTILSAGFLNTLYHLSVPVRTPWVSDLPGSFLALSIWILGSFVLRWILQSTVGGTSIYGPLAAPIAVLMWLYMTAIAVLIGAALNAVVDRLWPHKARTDAAAESASEVQARKDAEDEIEPVMKAEPDPHHEEHPLTPLTAARRRTGRGEAPVGSSDGEEPAKRPGRRSAAPTAAAPEAAAPEADEQAGTPKADAQACAGRKIRCAK